MSLQPYLPEGPYSITNTGEQAEVYYPSINFLSEVRVRWLPEDAAHAALNNLLAHISVLELDHLVEAAAAGRAFSVSALDDILPRPGWDIETRASDNPLLYRLQQKDEATVYTGPRRELLLLLELVTRSAIAPYIGEPPPRDWVERLRDAHPKLLMTLGNEALFEMQPGPDSTG